MAAPRRGNTSKENNSTTQAKTAEKAPWENYNFKDNPTWLFETTRMKPVLWVLKNDVTNRAYNPNSKENEPVRYAQGEYSIFVSEQSEKVRVEQVVFEDGLLSVNSNESTLLKFLFAHPDFGKTFRLVDRAGDAKAENERMKLELEARTKVLSSSFEELKVIANVLGLETQVEEVCRLELSKYASRNPEKILSMFNDDIVRIKSDIIEAINMGVLDIQADVIKWQNGGKIIGYPTGVDAKDYLASQLAQGGEKSEGILKELKKRIS